MVKEIIKNRLVLDGFRAKTPDFVPNQVFSAKKPIKNHWILKTISECNTDVSNSRSLKGDGANFGCWYLKIERSEEVHGASSECGLVLCSTIDFPTKILIFWQESQTRWGKGSEGVSRKGIWDL